MVISARPCHSRRLQHRLEETVSRQAHERLRPALLSLVPQLAEVAAEAPDRSADDLRRLVGYLVHERCEIDEGGDTACRDAQELDLHVEVVMRTLLALREDNEGS